MYEKIARFAYEFGMLKRLRRTGWWVAGVERPESVAEHSLRTAALAYVIALLEGGDPEHAAALALFHDLPECRTTDLHRLALTYFDQEKAELKATAEQLSPLPVQLKEALHALLDEYRKAESPEAKAARDADKLECLLQAREYAAGGVRTDAFMKTSRKGLLTSTAQALARAFLAVEPEAWWKEITPGASGQETAQ